MAREIALHMYNLSYTLFQPPYKRRMAAWDGLPVAQVGAYHKSTPEQIIAAARGVVGSDRVRVLRIMSHGNCGLFHFPGMWNYYLTTIKYADLRGMFAPLAKLEIHGCGVASETDTLKPGTNTDAPRESDAVPGTFTGNSKGVGLVYLKRVASIFNVPTVGAVDVQASDTWSYKGNTVTAYPFSDKFFMDSDGMRTWDFEAQKRAADKFWRRIMDDFVKKKLYRDALKLFKELAKQYPNTTPGSQASLIITIDHVERLLDTFTPDHRTR